MPTAGVAQLVERQPSKLQVAGSNLVSRSFFSISRFSSVVEHFLGKEEVMGSNPINGSDYSTSPTVGIILAVGTILSGKRRTVFYYSRG